MNKSQKRDAWTYLIVALLMVNLYVINNYITSKAVVIIKAKNNTSMHSTFNVDSLTKGVQNKYVSIISGTKKMFGIQQIVTIDANTTVSHNNDKNSSKQVEHLIHITTPVTIQNDKNITIPVSIKAKASGKDGSINTKPATPSKKKGVTL